MSTYSEVLAKHLAQYKRETLGVNEDGRWRRNMKTYPHILPEQLFELNILESIRRPFWAYARRKGLPLHTDFHHLTSSQAFAFNLFFPLLASSGESRTLIEVLGFRGVAVSDWDFEYVPDPAEGTNIDLVLRLSDGRQVAIEVKLAEIGFGAARRDPRHLGKREAVYMPRLGGKVRRQAFADDVFFPNYQLLRNIALADSSRGHSALFVLPIANTSAWSSAAALLQAVLLPELEPYVRMVAVESMVEDLLASPDLSQVTRSTLGFVAAKYRLGTAAT